MKALSVSPWKRAYTPDAWACNALLRMGKALYQRPRYGLCRGGDEAAPRIVVSDRYRARCAVSGWLLALLKNAASSAVASSNCSSWS